MNWKAVTSATPKSETAFVCQKCGKEFHMHTNYIKAGLLGCAKCFGVEFMAQHMLVVRTWKFVELVIEKSKSKIRFICDKQHDMTLAYANLKNGSGCKICIKESKLSTHDRADRIIRPICSCITDRGQKPHFCEHYNHEICQYGRSFEWNIDLNSNINPSSIAPKSAKKYWYTCSNDWCAMNYLQSPCLRTLGMGCSYCSGQKVCEWNCLLTNYPELCLELDPANEIKPDQITPGVSIKIGWICNKHKLHETDEPFRYTTQVNHRTSHGSGCPRCVRGGEQQIMGHEYFVQEANRIHENAYVYNEKYKGAVTPIEIYCPKTTKLIAHGIFKLTPHSHKQGRGCPMCTIEANRSKIMQELHDSIISLDYKPGINFFEEKSFNGLFHFKHLRVDAVLLTENAIIERDGGYHFHITSRGFDNLKNGQTRDLVKDTYCLRNGFNFLRLPYTIGDSKDIVWKFIELCRTGKQIYMSYQHYRNKLDGVIDFSKICFIVIPSPKGTVVAI